MTQSAKQFALHAHRNQKYGEHSYSFHLEAVVAVAGDHDLHEILVAACWLHDTMEDCGVKKEEIIALFGNEIAEIVFCVTDEPGKNRKERKEKTYPKIAANENAVCVKLCDRIANLKHSLQNKNTSLLQMYLTEHSAFRDKLFKPGAKTAALWHLLESLIAEAQQKID